MEYNFKEIEQKWQKEWKERGIYKVDVDKEERLAAFFDIRSIPTLISFTLNGEPKRSMGAKSKEQLRELLNSISK